MKRHRKRQSGRPLKHEADRIAPWRSSPDASSRDQDTKKRKKNN